MPANPVAVHFCIPRRGFRALLWQRIPSNIFYCLSAKLFSTTTTRSSSMRDRTACAGQSIDGEVPRAALQLLTETLFSRARSFLGTKSATHPAQEMPEKHDHVEIQNPENLALRP
jgi:hypothetical protein